MDGAGGAREGAGLVCNACSYLGRVGSGLLLGKRTPLLYRP